MNKEITVFRISESKKNVDEFYRWLETLGVSFEAREQFLVLDGPESVIAAAAKRCYNSFEVGLNPNVTKVRQDFVKYFDNVLASGHGSVLEHATFSYAIEGITRVGTAELNRHRAGTAISEGSMRYIRLDNGISWWLPMSLRGNDEQSVETRAIFEETFQFIEKQYSRLCELWHVDNLPFDQKKKLTSMFRRIVPMGVQTGGVWTFNVRALRHVIELRSTPHAEEEIALIVGLIISDLKQDHPMLFGDFVLDEFWTPKYHKV